MADDDLRAALAEMFEPARQPVADEPPLLWRDFECRAGPTFDQLALQLGRLVAEHPVRPLAPHLVPGSLEGARRCRSGVWSGGWRESLVGLLMPVHQQSNVVVFRFARHG